MKDQRKSSVACDGYVFAQAEDLIVLCAIAVVKVEPGFADPDDFRVRSSFQKIIRGQPPEVLCVVRMHTGTAPDVVMSFRNLENGRKVVEPVANREKPTNACGASAGENFFQVAGKRFAVKIDVCIEHAGRLALARR